MRPILLPALVLLSSCGGSRGLFGECAVSDARVLVYEYDDGDDGQVDFTETYTYDDDGNLSTKETRGRGHAIYTYTYNEDGHMLGQAIDNKADGTVNETEDYTYDAAGNRISLTKDWEADGVWDFRAVYEYNDDNLLIRETASTPDDGVAYSYDYSYDEHGNLASDCLRADNGGHCVTYSYKYDEDLHVVESCDSYDVCVQYAYDRHGGLITETTLRENGSYIVTFDGCDHQLTVTSESSEDWDGDGEVDWRLSDSEERTYDKEGNIETISRESYEYAAYGYDLDGDGVDDVQESSSNQNIRYYYTYE